MRAGQLQSQQPFVRLCIRCIMPQAEREADMARRLKRDRPAQGCGIDAHAHDCCCGGGAEEVSAPGTDIEPAGQAGQGAQA